MKNCPFCDQSIRKEALKCHYCDRWVVDTTKLKNKSNNTPWVIVFLFLGLVYHTAVIRAMRVEEAQQCSKWRVSSEAYRQCKEQISYWTTYFDFKKIINALD